MDGGEYRKALERARTLPWEGGRDVLEKAVAALRWDGRQHVAGPAPGHGDGLVLIPPLAGDFIVYGGQDTVRRARDWALRHEYLLAGGIPSCAHGLYLMHMCPVLASCGMLDHAELWVPARTGPGGRPFLLCHLYRGELPDRVTAYAKAHGLEVSAVGPGGDDLYGDMWYGTSTLAVRLTIPENWPLWPVEREVAVLLQVFPVAWPPEQELDEDGEMSA